MIVEVINIIICIFIKQLGMKQCPRCKSMLAKSHGEKMVCKTCGFVTRNLEVARENQQFQQRHHFGKKITISKHAQSMKSTNENKQLKNHYLVSYQNLLRTAANNLCKQDIEYQKIYNHVIHIWMAYINLAHRNQINIAGIFRKYLKKKKRGNNGNNVQSKQEDNDDILQKQQQDQNNDEPEPEGMLDQQEQHKQQPYDEQIPKKKRRIRKKKDIAEGLSTHQQKKIPFKLQIRRKLVQLQQNQQDLCEDEQRIKFLQFLYSTNERQIDNDAIDYMSNKYSSFLVQQLRNHNLNIGVSYAKGIPLKISLKQLELMVKMRGLKFTEKDQMHIVLLLQDLLRKWSEDVQIEQQLTLEELLLLYKSPQNPNTNHLISELVKRLISLMQQQEAMQKQRQNKVQFPELSFALIYAILYFAALLNSNTLTIDDIVSKCGILTLTFRNQKINSQQIINNHKIRRITAILFRSINIKCQASSVSIRKWVQKYAHVCGLANYANQMSKIGQVLFDSYKIAKSEQQQAFVIEKRYAFLQQDMIAKAVVIIFVKLEVGFQNYPFLSRFPPQLLAKLQQLIHHKKISGITEKQLKFLKNLAKQRENLISIPKIIKNMSTYFNPTNKRSVNIRLNYYANNYSLLQNLSMKNLVLLVKKYALNRNSLNFTINIAESHHNKQLPEDHKLKVIDYPDKDQSYKIRKKFGEQVQYAIKDKESGSFEYSQLDIPCSNYQFFYEYMSNIKHVGKDLFVLFVQTLAGRECKVKQLYQWLQRLQSVMLDFEN